MSSIWKFKWDQHTNIWKQKTPQSYGNHWWDESVLFCIQQTQDQLPPLWHCCNGLGKIFNGGKTLIKAISRNIKNPVAWSFGKNMEGGSGVITYSELASLLWLEISWIDKSGLSRWMGMTFSQLDGHLTTILVGYNPCQTPAPHFYLTYQLQQGYFTVAEKHTTCPHQWSGTDLLGLLWCWHEEGHWVIISLDANDHVYQGHQVRL